MVAAGCFDKIRHHGWRSLLSVPSAPPGTLQSFLDAPASLRWKSMQNWRQRDMLIFQMMRLSILVGLAAVWASVALAQPGATRDPAGQLRCPSCQPWSLHRISTTLHAVSTQIQRGGRALTLSFYRNEDGVVWLRLWFDIRTDAAIRAELSRLRASLRWIDVRPYSGAWLLSSEWPRLDREHVRFGNFDGRDWMDIRLGGDPAGWMSYATHIEVHISYPDRRRREAFLAVVEVSLNGRAPPIWTAIGPPAIR